MPIRALRLTVRNLLRTPLFTLTAVLSLALGIGATTAVFSAVDAAMLRSLPFPRERLKDQHVQRAWWDWIAHSDGSDIDSLC